MPTELDTKTQGAIRRRMSPLYQKERTEIPARGAGNYPFPPRTPEATPVAKGRGLAMGGGMGAGGGMGVGGAPRGLGVGQMLGAGTSATATGTPMAGLSQQVSPQTTPTVSAETQRDVLLALVLMLLGIGGGGQGGQ